MSLQKKLAHKIYLILFNTRKKARVNSDIFYITFLSLACPLPPPAAALECVPMMVHLMTAPADGDMSAMMKVSCWQCGYKWNIAIFLHSCPALSPRTMKVGPSSRTHTN